MSTSSSPSSTAGSGPAESHGRKPVEPHRGGAAKGEATKRRRGPLFWTVVGVVAAAAAVWLANFVRREILFEETDDAYVAGHMHVISSRLSETVTAVLVDENQLVKAGDPLVRLDSLAADIALKKAGAALDAVKAAVLVAQTAVDQASAEASQAEAQVAAADARVRQAGADLELALVNRRRNELLFNTDVRTISKADVDSTRSLADASDAGVAAAQAALAAARAHVRVSAAAVASAQAQETSAHAQVEQDEQAVRDAQRELSYTVIYAPVAGRIGNKNVEVGNRVQAGQGLFSLIQSDCWISANFKETQLRKMRPGQPVEITIDSIGEHLFTGRVDSISPATGAVFALLPPDNATGNFTKVVQRVPVKIVFDEDSARGYEERLTPGLSAVVSVRIK